MTESPSLPTSKRALALDALRGLAILAMLLSSLMPEEDNALPGWMYHAQVAPPHFIWSDRFPGITWVDLVFPFFLFSMGAAFPLAFSRRMDKGEPVWKLLAFVLERGFLLTFFALFVMDIRPHVLKTNPDSATMWVGLLGFLILFLILTRLPERWSFAAKFGIRAAGWGGACAFLWLAKYPDGSGFRLNRSDIIIIVLANMAVCGSLIWMATRKNLLVRLGVLGILLAIRLSNLPQPVPGWVHDVWMYSPLPWVYRLYYLQYLYLVIAGTIAGDLILAWTRSETTNASWSLARYACIFLTMAEMVLLTVIGLKARWLPWTALCVFGLCAAAWFLFRKPLNATEVLYQRLFNWAIYWLVLGLVFEPCEGGIKKDHPTMSYYFVTAGLALCVYIALSIIIDALQRRRWLQLLIDNGQNPMIAYAGINNLILPLLALIGIDQRMEALATTPWRGFWKGVIVMLLIAFTVSFLTRRKIFWRT